jgi:PDZ domain-containing protein
LQKTLLEHPPPPGVDAERPEPRRLPIPRSALGLILLIVLAGGILSVRLPYVILEPGPAPNAEALVRIGAPTHARAGSIHLTTVSLFDQVRLPQLAAAWLNRSMSVVPRVELFPANQSQEQVSQQNAADMDESQRDAGIAALGELYGYQSLPSKGVLVAGTVPSTPAARLLQTGDVITAVDGRALTTPDQLESVVQAHAVGQPVHLSVTRGSQTLGLDVATVQNSQPPPAPQRIVGVQVEPDYVPPVDIKIDAGSIGGPSAGLSWALSIVNLLGPADLSRGRTIADTGTIDYRGNIGPIGGIAQKVIGAERVGATIFLVPKDQAREAQARAAGSHMKVVGVSTLHEAVVALSNP